jgi:flagella basal body P-ring formation protein FlgA
MIIAGHISSRTVAFIVGVAALVVASAVCAAEGLSPVVVSPVVVSPVVRQAMERALATPGARLDSAVEERGAARAGDCRATEAEVSRPIEGSGRVAVKLAGRSPRGQRCEGWTWVRVRVVAPVAIAAHALRAGEPLDNAVTTQERELRAGHPPAQVGPTTVAARAIAAGQPIESSEVTEPTLRSGDAVKVVIVSGALVIEQMGRAVPCMRGRGCAVLSTGKHVEGDLIDGRLVVQSP